MAELRPPGETELPIREKDAESMGEIEAGTFAEGGSNSEVVDQEQRKAAALSTKRSEKNCRPAAALRTSPTPLLSFISVLENLEANFNSSRRSI
jgi:hypothetical protein